MSYKTLKRDEGTVEAVEAELRYLSAELHKGLCQSLVGVGMLVHLMLRDARQNEPIQVERLANLEKMIDGAIDGTRALLKSLNPREPEFGGFGLMTMLQALVAEQSRQVRCEFKCKSPVFIAEDRIAHTLFRVAQECCRVDLKGSRLKTIRISLFQERNCINLEVRYQGRNLQEQNCLRESGLMHARARSVGGELKLHSKPTYIKIVCTVPIPRLLGKKVAGSNGSPLNEPESNAPSRASM